MSTYIQGVTDYIPEIQPFKPDLNFLGNVMQTRQSRYDASKQQISDLYGSMLYGPMSREDNIKNRDEFFKVIDNEIKKISGLDLSLQQNTDQALNLFKNLTEDKNIVNDMVKTKNYNTQVQKGLNLKNCTDPKKCGDVQYWDEGMKKLQYKMDEFKKISADEALNFDLGEYDAKYNWQKDAMKLVTDLKYDVSQDDVTKEWIVHNTNGELVEGGLYGVFTSVYGADPRVSNNYDTEAYVHRKDGVTNGITQYGSEEASQQNYVQTMMKAGMKVLNNDLKNQTNAYDQLNNRQLQLEQTLKTKGLTDEEKVAYQQVLQQKQIVESTKEKTQSEIDDIQNNLDKNDIRTLLYRTDKATAAAFKERDMKSFAKIMSLRGAKSTLDINPVYKMDREHSQAVSLANYKFGLDLKKLNHQHGLKMDFEKFKKALENEDLGIDEGVEIDADPEDIVNYDLEETPGIGYEKSRENQAQTFTQATSLSSDFLYKMFHAAKTAATTENNGADQYLKKTYGDDWRTKITDKESLLSVIKSKKLSPLNVFNSTYRSLDQKKNPTADIEWAQSYLNSSKKDSHYVKQYNDAALSKIKFNTDNNKKIVALIQKNKTEGNEVAADADLLLDGGFLMDYDEVPKKFIQGYLKRHPNRDEDDAEDAYEALKPQFYNLYNTSKDVSLNQGVGLKGTGFSQASTMYYPSLDSKNKKGTSGDIVHTINNILGQQGYYSAKIGASGKSNYSDKSDALAEEGLKTFLRDAINANSKTTDRPIFSAKIIPQAAQNEKLSAISLTFAPDYIKKLTGSKEAPGILYGKDLSKGLTLFYNNDIPTRFSEAAKMSNFETNLRVNKSASISEYDDIAGSLNGVYDDVTNLVTFTPTVKAYNPKTGKLEIDEMDAFSVPINQVKTTEDTWLSTFEAIQAKNLRDSKQIAKLNK